MQKNKLADTKRIKGKLQSHGHEFHYWIEQIKAPKWLYESEPENREGQNISDLHQRLRYGIQIPDEIETNQMRFIQNIIEKVGKYL